MNTQLSLYSKQFFVLILAAVLAVASYWIPAPKKSNVVEPSLLSSSLSQQPAPLAVAHESATTECILQIERIPDSFLLVKQDVVPEMADQLRIITASGQWLIELKTLHNTSVVDWREPMVRSVDSLELLKKPKI